MLSIVFVFLGNRLLDHALRLRRLLRPLGASVHIFDVPAQDYNTHPLGAPDRRRCPAEVPNRPDAGMYQTVCL
jgi:hypothetical protein